MTMSKKRKFSVVISLVLCMSILFSGTVFAIEDVEETTTEVVEYYTVGANGEIEPYIHKYSSVTVTQMNVEKLVETEMPAVSERVKITAKAFSDNIEMIEVRVTEQMAGQEDYGKMVLFETGSMTVDVKAITPYVVRVAVIVGDVSSSNPGTISLYLETL